jgi:hypothetical protein
MAAKGIVAKTKVIEKIKEALGEDFIGEVDKKIYVWADDGGERIQVAIALTCPKVPIETSNASTPKVVDIPEVKTETFNWGGLAAQPGAWGNKPAAITPEPKPAIEITDDERNRIAMLIEKLGL